MLYSDKICHISSYSFDITLFGTFRFRLAINICWKHGDLIECLQNGVLAVWKADATGCLTTTPLSSCQATAALTHVILNACNLSPSDAESV